MEINLIAVPYKKKFVLQNLLELYLYDMSEFSDEQDKMDINEGGLFGYKYLDHYWTEDGRYPYFIIADGVLSGLCLIRTMEQLPLTFEVAEFFVLKKYRKSGVGKTAMSQVFERYKGRWIINTPIKNLAAQSFWRKVVENAAHSAFTEGLIEAGRRKEWTFSNNK